MTQFINGERVFGCISEIKCEKCNTIYRCDSSGKAGTKEGNVTYVLGPCCCGYFCPNCYPNGLKDLYPKLEFLIPKQRYYFPEYII